MDHIKWGIIGCGNIANQFSKDLKALQEAELCAVASKTPGKAKSFAQAHEVENYYENYKALLENDQVDVVYVATTHNLHYENVLLCLNHGKHVLCEKVFTMNGKQARHLMQVAKSKNLFVMEAMWTRFLPAITKMKGLIKDGVIGEVEFLEAEFSFKCKKDPLNRLYNKNLAGGSLMDQGIYPISFASMLFGKQPSNIKSSISMADTGVDEMTNHLFDYGNGKTAVLTTSMQYYWCKRSIIAGTKGYIELPEFLDAQEFTVVIDGVKKKYEMPFEGTGRGHEAEEVMACIRAGKIQSDIMPLDESVAIMETLDAIRRENGLLYPEAMERCFD